MKRKVKMFQRLRTASYMKMQGDGNAISVGFTGRVARIARVHQYGLKDRASQGTPDIKYEQRETLGFTETDIQFIRDILLSYFTHN